MIPASGASNKANGQSSPDNNQVNPSRSMLTGGKKRNQEAIGEGNKKRSRLRLTGESPNLGVESSEVLIMVKRVEQSGKNLSDQINRRMTRAKEKHWDQLRNYPEVSATVRQIEEKWPLLSNLRKIKENMKENLAEFKAGCLMEVDAKQKLLQVKKELNHIDLQLQLYSGMPCMKEIAATNDHESLENQFYDNDNGFHGLPLESTITIGMLQQGGSEASEAPYGANRLPFLLDDNQMGSLSGSKNRNGELVLGNFSEAGGQGTEINDAVITFDQDDESLVAREMLKRNYSSWQIKLFNKENNCVEVAHFHGLQQALDKTRYGETPDYLKPIATRIEMDRGEATKFHDKNIEVMICAAIKEMEEWRTPNGSDGDLLKKWAATLNMGKERDFEVKFADDMLKNICLAYYAYSMIYGEDGSIHKAASCGKV